MGVWPSPSMRKQTMFWPRHMWTICSSIVINSTDDKYMSLSQNKLLTWTYYPQLMAEFQIMILFWIPISSNKWCQFWMSICLISIHVFFSVLDHHFWPHESMSLKPHGHRPPILTLIERYIHDKPSRLGKTCVYIYIYHVNHTISLTWNLRPNLGMIIYIYIHIHISLTKTMISRVRSRLEVTFLFTKSLSHHIHSIPMILPFMLVKSPWFPMVSYGFLWFPMVSHDHILVFLQFSFTTCTARRQNLPPFQFPLPFWPDSAKSNGNPMDIQWEFPWKTDPSMISVTDHHLVHQATCENTS